MNTTTTTPRITTHAERNAEFKVGRQVRMDFPRGEEDEFGVGEIVATWIDTRPPNHLHHRLWVLVAWPGRAPIVYDPAPGMGGTYPLLLVPLIGDTSTTGR